jgi:signal transduction histidine kinase
MIELAHQRGVLDERMRMTQDLHDGLGSQIVSALALFQNGQIGAADIEELLQGCMDEIRTIICTLSASEPDPCVALATLCHRMRPRLAQAGIDLHWTPDIQCAPRQALNAQQTLQLVRITQEALANILKYSQATRAEVRLTLGTVLRLRISDNGRGISQGKASTAGNKGSGLGLGSMQTRATQLNASFAVHSHSLGTQIEIATR